MTGNGGSTITTDHDEIKRWADSRGAKPAIVKGTKDTEKGRGMIRFDFTEEAALEPISWEEFFEIFEKHGLALLYQNRTKSGGESRFFKFVSR